MAFRPAGPARPAASRPIALPRWTRYVLPAALVAVAFIVIIAVAAGIWTDFLWFRSVRYTSVFDTTYGVKWALFGVTAIFMMAVIGLNIWLAYRLRPERRPPSAEQQGLEAYRLVIDPRRRLVAGTIVGLIGLISGLAAAGSWRTWMLFANRTAFGVRDPQFHMDLSFFIFDYPFIRMVLSFLFAAVLLSLLLAAAVHYLYGGVRIQLHGERATPRARAHLFILVGTFMLLKAVAYWVDRYGIDFSQRGVVQTGASYTDVNAVLPAKTVLAVIAVICAALFFAGAIRRNVMLPAVGFGLLVLSAVIIGGVYPAIVQQFVVKPNELVKEGPYLSREISSTRLAYGLTHVKVTPYSAVSPEPTTQLAQQAAALPDVRQLDPGVVSASFQQLQQVKGYYTFPGVLSVDRYQVPGSSVPQDMIVGVRDMSGPPAGQNNWINAHLVYTHGFGFVAASADAAASGGNPSFTEFDIPPLGELNVAQPRVYFGQGETSYAIVGGRQQELDYPNQSASGQANTTYRGSGGVPVGSVLNRLLYAVKFRELNILLSGAIDGNSKIMYVRDPLSRVEKVAPFLTLDGNTYPVVVGGQIEWVVDAYTTTDNYPYSQRISLQQASSNSYSPGGSTVGPAGQVNYIRNSVKAVVNAYTGAVTLYQWGSNDPVLDAWKKAFPGVIKPQSAIPADLLPHLRYPPVLFEAQRQILAQFHVTQAPDFYGGQNFWTVPTDPSGTAPNASSQPPYYLTMTMPGQPQPEFSLTTSLTPRGRANMAAFMEVNSNPKSAGYGTIRVLQLPQDTTIRGPQQVQNDFESDAPVASALSLLRQQGSRVTEGNLITLPVGGGLVYFEPVYVSQSVAGSSGAYPTLQDMLVYYNGQIGFAKTLAGALSQVFGTSPPPGTGGTSPPGSHGTPQNALVLKYLQQAEADYTAAQAALRSDNLAAYGSDLAQMKAALDNAKTAAQGSTSAPATSSPGSSPSPAPAPTPTP
ncbi:MAG TPA: UPF0182 family protein [Streptosporangiaceae bacterium]|nr:UPF0182 family protein [Streptosporangiaceae bacterium]